MNVAMVYPHPDSEKGISAYSLGLIDNIRKQGVKIEGQSFFQGKPSTIFDKIFGLRKYDVIHIQHEYNLLGGFGTPYFLLLGFLWLLKKKFIIVTMHNVLSQEEKFNSGRLKTALRKILYKIQNRWINWTSDKVVVHSKSFRKILIKEYGFKKNKITVLPHAIIENIKTINQIKAKKELNLSGPVYLMIGTMVPDHGHDIVINQADKIGKTIVVATNPSAVNYKNKSKIIDFLKLNQSIIKIKKLEKFVRLDLGPISYDKWWKYLSAADLILLPYRGGIGSGIFADAMAIKKPVIGSNIPYFKEFAQEYGCITLAENENDFPRAIKTAMKPRNYRKMVSECKRYFNENGLTPISKKYKILYESLTNQIK